MAYCTQADVEVSVGGAIKLAQLSDQDNLLAGAVNTAAVTAAIAEATAELASYIGHRVSVTAIAATVPDIVKMKAAAWAARVLRRNAYNGQPMIDDIDREKIDREWLDGVAKGIYSLGVEPTPVKASIVNDKAGLRDPTMRVSAARLRGYF